MAPVLETEKHVICVEGPARLELKTKKSQNEPLEKILSATASDDGPDAVPLLQQK
jgi:hypothetical protein